MRDIHHVFQPDGYVAQGRADDLRQIRYFAILWVDEQLAYLVVSCGFALEDLEITDRLFQGVRFPCIYIHSKKSGEMFLPSIEKEW